MPGLLTKESTVTFSVHKCNRLLLQELELIISANFSIFLNALFAVCNILQQN